MMICVDEFCLDVVIVMVFKDRVCNFVVYFGLSVVLDLMLVDFMDSFGLGVIIVIYKFLLIGWWLEFVGLLLNVEWVFCLMCMDMVLLICVCDFD